MPPTTAFCRSIYFKIELTADIIYILFYGLVISWLFQHAFKPDSKMQKWKVMPVGAGFFGLLENVGVVSMLSMYPSKPAILAMNRFRKQV